MINPEDVDVIYESFELVDYEKIIDYELKKPWALNETRVVFLGECTEFNIHKIVKMYWLVGWNCATFGNNSIVFYSPKPKKPKKWWQFWK